MVPTLRKLLHPGAARVLEQQRSHHQVLVEEAAGVQAVGADPSHHGGEMDDDLRPEFRDHALGLPLVREVVLARVEGGGVREPALRQRRHQVPAQESMSAGDDDAGVALDHSASEKGS